LQYRYDARWRAARDDVKYHDLLAFAGYLPGLRRTLAMHLRSPGLSREKVLAAVVSVLAETGARIGNARYREQNGSFGLTTLLDRHVRIGASQVELAFRGKGGKPYRTRVRDRTLARTIAACRDVPGQRLFQYSTEAGRQSIESGDVNAYLQRISSPRFTAKTFRTWIASVSALAELRALEPAPTLAGRKRQLNVALARVAERLGNTVAICRKSYVHPALPQAFLDNNLTIASALKRRGLTDHECDLVSVLEHGALERAAA
jgi:DNA topoisomerase I